MISAVPPKVVEKRTLLEVRVVPIVLQNYFERLLPSWSLAPVLKMYGDGVDFGHKCMQWMIQLELGQSKVR